MKCWFWFVLLYFSRDISQSAELDHVAHNESVSLMSNQRENVPTTVDGTEECQIATYVDPPKSAAFAGKPCGRRFRKEWRNTYSWIEFVEETNKVYCQVCKQCETMQLFNFATKRETAFTSTGFANWKHATETFQSHEQSAAHREAIMKIYSATHRTNVSKQLSKSHSQQMLLARTALLKIVSAIQYLTRQGLAIRGHSEKEGNFSRLLELRSDDCTELKTWLARSSYKWTSPLIQNELIECLALTVLRNLMNTLKTDKYYSVMVDETTDISVAEQVSFCFRHVDSDLQVHEQFVGFYSTSLTNADILFKLLQDVVVRFDLGLDNCRGQCYDGAANMSGKLSGVQARLTAIYPKAIYIHCANHCLNLMFQDALCEIKECRDAMYFAKDVINFVRSSPKRLACFEAIQDDDATSLRPLCPTRWTMRVSSVQTLMDNYDSLINLLTELSDECRGETGAKVSGFLKQLLSFETFFGLKLLITIFSRCETVATQLQSSTLSLAECQRLVSQLRVTWVQQRTDLKFDTLWAQASVEADAMALEKPELPRVRRPPRRLDDGAHPHVFVDPKARYRQIYYQAIDECVGALDARFQSPVFALATNIENTVIDAAQGRPFDLTQISEHFGDDLDKRRLELHLSMLNDLVHSLNEFTASKPSEINDNTSINTAATTKAMPTTTSTTTPTYSTPTTVSSITSVINLFLDNPHWRQMLSEVTRLLTLYLCIPVTSCTAERSFSSLRRLKTFLRSTMSQERLNHVAVLHVHKDLTDNINLHELCNDFISRNDMRRKTFAMF